MLFCAKKTLEKIPNIQSAKNMRKNSIREPLEKTPNIREMRQVWKSAILQRL